MQMTKWPGRFGPSWIGLPAGRESLTRHAEWFEEANIRLVADVEGHSENAKFFERYKDVIKQRFQQIDIWIVSSRCGLHKVVVISS
jgi:hypothetical protein